MSVCSFDETPYDLVCPITQEIFQDPVMDRNGRTYERKAILMWLASKGTCPLTRQPAKPSNYITNVKMQSTVRLYQLQQGQSSSTEGSASTSEDEQYITYEEREKNDERRSSLLFMFDVPDAYYVDMVTNIPSPQQTTNNGRRRRRRFRLFR
jgi:hypothetical protein